MSSLVLCDICVTLLVFRRKILSMLLHTLWNAASVHGAACHTPRQPLQKPSYRGAWRMGDAVVGRGKSGWTTSKSGNPCSYQNCLQGPPAEKTGRGSVLNRPSCPQTKQSVKGQNWTELNFFLCTVWFTYIYIYNMSITSFFDNL